MDMGINRLSIKNKKTRRAIARLEHGCPRASVSGIDIQSIARRAFVIVTRCKNGYEWTDYDRSMPHKNFDAWERPNSFRGGDDYYFIRLAIPNGYEEMYISGDQIPAILTAWREEAPRDAAIKKWGNAIAARLSKKICHSQWAHRNDEPLWWAQRRDNEQFRLAQAHASR